MINGRGCGHRLLHPRARVDLDAATKPISIIAWKILLSRLTKQKGGEKYSKSSYHGNNVLKASPTNRLGFGKHFEKNHVDDSASGYGL